MSPSPLPVGSAHTRDRSDIRDFVSTAVELASETTSSHEIDCAFTADLSREPSRGGYALQLAAGVAVADFAPRAGLIAAAGSARNSQRARASAQTHRQIHHSTLNATLTISS
jgi:hypothetical protein